MSISLQTFGVDTDENGHRKVLNKALKVPDGEGPAPTRAGPPGCRPAAPARGPRERGGHALGGVGCVAVVFVLILLRPLHSFRMLLDRLEKVEEKVDMLLQVSTLHALAKAVRMCCGVLHVRCLLSSALEHARPLSVLTAICPHLRPSCHKIFCKDDLVSTVVARLLDVRRQTPHQ